MAANLSLRKTKSFFNKITDIDTVIRVPDKAKLICVAWAASNRAVCYVCYLSWPLPRAFPELYQLRSAKLPHYHQEKIS